MKKGDALLGVSSQELHQRLRGSPWVKDAVVRKDVSGKIEIKVSEAVPIAILEISDAPSLVDREGIVLEQLRDDAVLLLPVIKDIDPERDKEAYAEAVRFVRFLHDKRVISFNGNIEVTGKRPEDLSIKVDDIIIKVGAGDIERKLQRLKVVIEEIDRKKMAVEYIDIRFENKIIVKSASRHTAVDKKTAAESDEKKKKR
jgi:cell division protein FtsQ